MLPALPVLERGNGKINVMSATASKMSWATGVRKSGKLMATGLRDADNGGIHTITDGLATINLVGSPMICYDAEFSGLLYCN